MSDKRRGLGRGLGALIPTAPSEEVRDRPVDVFFREQPRSTTRETPDHGASMHSTQDVSSQSSSSGSTPSAPVDDGQVPGSDVPDASGLEPVPGATFAQLPLDAIQPNRAQPRTAFDEDAMAELVHSIAEIGVLQPIVVRPLPADEATDAPDGAKYELIMGERRWRASREAGQETVPTIIKDTRDDDLLRDALLENLHRSQLNPLEEAAAYQQLLEDFGCTQEELASRIGRSRPQISNTLRLLKLPPLVARRVAAGVISAGHARALLSLGDNAQIERLAQRIVAENLSVRAVEEIVAMGLEPEKAPRAPVRRADPAPEIADLAAAVSDRLETRVKIAVGQRKGRMTVEFASVEDLHRILDAMGVRAD